MYSQGTMFKLQVRQQTSGQSCQIVKTALSASILLKGKIRYKIMAGNALCFFRCGLHVLYYPSSKDHSSPGIGKGALAGMKCLPP
jgi:hypothetical protein